MNDVIKYIFLGTGDKCGIPKIGCQCETCLHAKATSDHTMRLRSAGVLMIGDSPVFIDVGPDLRYQMIREKLSTARAIFITHPHYDHVSGLHEFYRVAHGFDLFALPAAHDYIENQLGFRFLRYIKHPLVAYQPIDYMSLRITPLLVNHRMWEGMDALGFAIEKNGFKVVITGDTTRRIPDQSLQLMMDPDILIADAFSEEFVSNELPHMVLPEAIDLARTLKAEKMYLTHLSHRTLPHDQFEDKLQAIDPAYHVAYDGLTLDLFK